MKTRSILMLFLSCLFIGCNGGSKYVNNESLGKFPSVFVELNKKLAEQKEKWKSATPPSNPDKLTEWQKKWKAEEKKTKAEAQVAAAEELENIIERTVPFEFDYEDPDFEVRSAMIENGDIETGALNITLVIGAKHKMKASENSYLHYLIMDKEGKYLTKGRINPFVSIQIITNQTFPHKLTVAEGDVCSWQGSYLMLYCASYDYTDFSHILFINKASYNAL